MHHTMAAWRQLTMLSLDVYCVGNMAEGSMRCDVNISVRPRGSEKFGTKVEVKNMNSFSNMQKAIEFEIERQVSYNLNRCC